MMATFISRPLCSSAFWVLLSITALGFICFYLVFLRQTERWKRSNIPYLQPTFIIGHRYFLNATKYPMSALIDQMYRENEDKKVFGFFMGTLPLILIRDPELINQVFVKNSSKTFATGFDSSQFEIEAAMAIPNDKNVWKFGRRTMMPLFSSVWLRGLRFERLKEAISELLQKSEKIESDGLLFNVKESTKNVTLAVSCCNFGIENDAHEMKDDLEAVAEKMVEVSFGRFIGIYATQHYPALQFLEPFKVFSSKSCGIMSRILKQKFELRDQINIEKEDFIDFLRSLRDKQESEKSCNKNQFFLSTEKEIRARQLTGLALELLLGGVDTSRHLLAFAIHAISLYPEYQRKIRREAHEAMKKHGVSEFTFDVVKDLNFTNQCLYETLRLYPMIQMLLRRCSEDFQIQGTNYVIRKGDRVVVAPYSMVHDVRHFRNPHKFDPERFNAENASKIPDETFLVFGVGPRKCPGYMQAISVVATIIASLLYKYDIRPHSHLKLMDASDFCPLGFTNSPKRDILVRVVRCKHLHGA